MEDTFEYLEPTAIGLEYIGVWDQAGDSLNKFVYPDVDGSNGGVGTPMYDYVVITLASLEYFTQATTDEEREYQSCEMLAYYFSAPSDFESHEFDWDAGYGSTGNVMPTWGSYDGFVSIIEDSMSERCFALNPDTYLNGDPIDTFNGIRVGFAFGELTDHLENTYDDFASQDSDFAEYWTENKIPT